MSVRKFAAALAATVALCAVAPSGAFAITELKTVKSSWEEGETTFIFPRQIKCSNKGEKFQLKGTVLGAEFELTATGVECLSTEGGFKSTLYNMAVGGVNMALGGAELRFTGVKVVKPAGCGTPTTLTTSALSTILDMETSIGLPELITTINPGAGKIATVKVTECAIEGSYPLSGALVAESTLKTGESKSNMPAIFNAATNAVSSLTLGANSATLLGEANVELINGAAFRATEK
jgi:hypothetical protein